VLSATALSVGALLGLSSALASGGSVRVTSEELHRGGGVPPGWRFTIPAGDPAKGREVFAALECHSCHEVTGAGFPAKATGKSGPDLTRMGAHHPAEYFAESILDPNAVIIDAPGFHGPDGRSTMPSYNDSLTLDQWVNLVAYLKGLTGDGGQPGHDAHGGHAAHGAPPGAGTHELHGGHDGHGPQREATIGEYRVRLDYAEPDDDTHPGYLTVSILDAASGQPVPYLPVTARIGKRGRPITLRPVLGPAGLHYGAAVRVSDQAGSVTVSVGKATARVTAGDGGRYRTAREVSFEW